MANFFLDNDDIQFLFDHLDLAELAGVQEDGFVHAADDPSGYAPRDAADAVDNYRRVLAIVGEAAGEMMPRTPNKSIARATPSTRTAPSPCIPWCSKISIDSARPT